ncbi:MAG: hypothetical protein ACI4EX_07585 [Lachnospiraceae bacterium]
MFCPKCNNEYRPGIYKCAECNCELVESEEDIKLPLTFAKDLESLEPLREFLENHKIAAAEIKENPEEEVYEILVPRDRLDKSKRLMEVYLLSVKQEQQDDLDEDEPEAEKRGFVYYQDNGTKAAENKSSAMVLLFVGIAGMIVIIAGITGILPIRLSGTSKYMTYGTMSALFLIFIIMGLISMKSYKVFAKKAESENSLKESMSKWAKENITKEVVDAEALEDCAEISEEEKYFRRTEVLKSRISKQFMNLDDLFLERFVDEIYSKMYENN